MRKNRAALAAVFIVALGTLFASPVQAAADSLAGPNCAAMWRNLQGDGFFRAFDGLDCREPLGASRGDDANWNDASGDFRSGSNDRATSLLNTGTPAGGVNNVAVFSNAGHTGYFGCMAWLEHYVDDLRDNRLIAPPFSIPANNNISSHKWTAGCVNPLT